MKTSIIISISIIIIGGLIALTRVREDQSANKRVIYKLRIVDLFAKLYLSVPFFVLMILTLFILIPKIFTDSIFYAFALVLPILLGFLSIPSLILFWQYYRVEHERTIEFDPEKRRMFIYTKKSKIQVKNSDIRLIEYHKATPDKGPFDFEFVILTKEDGSKLILTNLLTDLLNYEWLFKGVKRDYQRMRIFNKINCG